MATRAYRYTLALLSVFVFSIPAAAQTCPLPPVPALGIDTVQHVSGAICARETCQAQHLAFSDRLSCAFAVVRVVIGTEEILCGAYGWSETIFGPGKHQIIGCCPAGDVAQPDGSCGAPVFDDGMGPPVCKGRGDDGNPWAASSSTSISTVPAGVGDPINVANGNQYIHQDDIIADGLRFLNFRRHYNSNPYRGHVARRSCGVGLHGPGHGAARRVGLVGDIDGQQHRGELYRDPDPSRRIDGAGYCDG